jgi:hypothetical protein
MQKMQIKPVSFLCGAAVRIGADGLFHLIQPLTMQLRHGFDNAGQRALPAIVSVVMLKRRASPPNVRLTAGSRDCETAGGAQRAAILVIS